MPFQPTLLRTSFTILVILLLSAPITAQEEQPAPQFLYRDDNRLILLDGYTGETTELTIEVSDGDRFEWSPDWRYLLTFLYKGGYSRFCMNLYDVDAQMWLHEKPISCGVTEAIFSDQGIDLIYVSDDEYNAVLWQYTIGGETKRDFIELKVELKSDQPVSHK